MVSSTKKKTLSMATNLIQFLPQILEFTDLHCFWFPGGTRKEYKSRLGKYAAALPRRRLAARSHKEKNLVILPRKNRWKKSWLEVFMKLIMGNTCAY